MWKTNLVRLAYRLNAYLNAAGLGSLRVVRGVKARGKQLMTRLLVQDNLLLVRVHGLLMYVDANTAEFEAYTSGSFEPYTTELFKRAIRPGATVLDIGAQFGYFSLIAAQRAGLGGRVYAFEPVPSNLEILERNVRLNGYTEIIQPVQRAIGDSHTPVNLFLYERSASHSMYRHPAASVRATIEVQCITVDEFVGREPVDVIKMDIEGHEPHALEGMRKTMSRCKHLVLFAELAPAYLRRAGVEPADYLAQLASLGFDVQLIDENSHSVRPITTLDLHERDPSWYANLLCKKGDSDAGKQ